MLPPRIPIFPLPNAVLFPGVFLPLHIFEPRYREMVADALDGDRLIGMVLLCPDGGHDEEGVPTVYPVGCAGLITHVETLADGRYNIVLRGLTRFRILDEDRSRAYRVARVESLPDGQDEAARTLPTEDRHRLEAMILPSLDGQEIRLPPNLSDEELVNALSQYLQFDPLERQALLEQDGLAARCRSLVELLEMKLLSSRASQRHLVH
ncbi:MAG: LON peptidase substrate-binding domain-containing protein [Acidobacteria bacterium]|nr:LON peptidase substrate-binding domain-containing protein [Acidobacteriota bacterium]